MQIFDYTAKNAQGKVLRDVITADSRQQALGDLRGMGLTAVDLLEVVPREVEPDTGWQHGSASVAEQILIRLNRLKAGRIKTADMAMFCRQLAISINSGLTLRDTLEGIYEDLDDLPALKELVGDLSTKLQEGRPFSEAVAAHPDHFSPVFIGLVRAAEASGSMGETLEQLAKYMEASEKLARKVKSMMAYPLFVACFFVMICLLMVFFIVPRFQNIFTGLGADLPKLTVTVFAINDFIVSHFPILVLALAALAASLWLYRKTGRGQFLLSKMRLKMPVTGKITTMYILARLCRCLAILLKSGVPVVTALEIIARIGDNGMIESAILAARVQIIAGTPIAKSLGQTQLFPALLIRMIGVGEGAGKLPEVLGRVADSYEDQVEASLATGMALLEPVIITVFGMLVLILVLSIYLPVFTVSMSIK
jgi:type II secretory pathway component PulF